jgi:LuxR family transcriptional regulator, maltose regulon positive regulatory protein
MSITADTKIPLLTTKFHIPSCRADCVARSHLLKELQRGWEENRNLTLISAPAGYGKTTLVTGWLSFLQSKNTNQQTHISWLSLDDAENDPMRFLRYLLTALQQADVRLSEQTMSTIGNSIAQRITHEKDLPAIPHQIDDLLNDLAAMDSSVVLVLDDYHVITNPEIHAVLEYFIEHQPNCTHLVLTTRADPPLPLARLRARRQLTEIRARDLRFTGDESRSFFRLANLPLPESDLNALNERTEGWVAGLQLAAIALQHQSDPAAFIETFRGSHRYVLDYLAGEVIQQQNEQTRDFLMQTSLLDRFNADLCNAITGRDDSQEVITSLEQSNLFIIPLDDERRWYRYHHLFAEFLKSHLKLTLSNSLQGLHRRATEWFQSNGYAEDALRHAFAIPDYPYASRLVVDNWRRVYHQGRLNTAVEWLDSLPPDFVRQSPPLGVAYCWTLFVRGDYDRIEVYIDEITQTFEQMATAGKLPAEHPEYNIVLQQLILLRAIVMRHDGDVSAALKEIEQLLPTIEELRQTLGNVVADMGYTACYSQMGYTYVAANDLEQAAETLSRVSPHARRCGNFLALAHTTIELARISLLLGRLEQAETICRDELSLTEQAAYADYPAFCLIQMALANVLCVRNSWDEAENLLNQGLETARRSGHEYYLAQGYLIAAQLHHSKGKSLQAQEEIQKAEQIATFIHNRFLDDAIAQTRKTLQTKSLTAQNLIDPLERTGNPGAETHRCWEIKRRNRCRTVHQRWHGQVACPQYLAKTGVGNRAQAIARSKEMGI